MKKQLLIPKAIGAFAGMFFLAIFTVSAFAKMAEPRKVSYGGYGDKKPDFVHDTAHDLRTVKVKEYALDIPKHLYACSGLNDEASAQYEDTVNELYIIVIDESKADFVNVMKENKKYKEKLSVAENYRNVEMRSLKKSIKIKGKRIERRETIHNLDAQIEEVNAKARGIEETIAYKFAFIEGPENMYYVTIWTLSTSEQINHAEMEGMINSFRVVK